MTFAEAIQHLVNGCDSIRRPSWAHYEDIYIYSWGNVAIDVMLTKDDLLANDWEVIK